MVIYAENVLRFLRTRLFFFLPRQEDDMLLFILPTEENGEGLLVNSEPLGVIRVQTKGR